jgi:hypothetical protein
MGDPVSAKHAQARAVMRRMANEAGDIWECHTCGAHRPRGTKCCGRYLGLNDGAGTKVAQRRNVHEHPDADEDEVADFLQAALARLDREAEPRVRAPTPGDDPSTDGDESDDHDSDDDHDPVTRIDLIRAVHLGFKLAFEGMGHFVHPKKVALSLGPLDSDALAFRARFELHIGQLAPAFKHYSAARISVLVPADAMGNRDAIEGIGTRRGSYPITIELAPVHTSGELFNCSDRNITHPMMDEAGDSIKRFYVTSRPFHYGRTSGDLMIHAEDRLKIFDWVRKFLAYAPPPVVDEPVVAEPVDRPVDDGRRLQLERERQDYERAMRLPSTAARNAAVARCTNSGVLPGASPEEILASQRMSASIEAAKLALRRGPEVHMFATNYGPTSLPGPKAPPRPNPPPPPKSASAAPSAPAPIVDDASRCEVCFKRTTKHCGACKIAYFCSRECQLAGHERGHPASCAFHKQILQIGLTPSGSLDNRVHAKTLPSFRGSTEPEIHNGISKAILNAAFDPLTEHSTRAVATAQVAQSDAFIAAAIGLCGTGGESQGQGEPLTRECMRLALKLSNAQLRYKNKAGKPGAAHAIAVMKPVRLDRLDHTGERRSVRALLVEIIKFTGADPPDAALLYAKRTPAIPTEVERVALELEHGSAGENEAPVLKVVMEPNTKEAKQIDVRDDVPRLLTPGLLNAVFGGA